MTESTTPNADDGRRRTLIVTGGARGIGAAVCRLAAGRGYDVVVQYREQAARAAQVVAQVQAAGAQARRGRGCPAAG